MVKLLTPEGDTVGRLTPLQALVLCQSSEYVGGGSPKRTRYIRRVPEKTPLPLIESFCLAHCLPRYDPTYFRTFGFPSGISPDQTSFSRTRRK